ncbi:LPS biosynthesis choline kinase [Pleurocapsa sp. CCALA 161]|uniref:phosphotransferase n=1 Tax=Pleurocapsa sp. CCALA 161 TaxID=2107688 RepID=UPI000D07738F|nr:phosphotransferase [Pleurocapsa sp. CCALA 161]PSB07667.1 LPS biosynthesis choline kinase [Pleurocapsa sp. CCALA 161]
MVFLLSSKNVFEYLKEKNICPEIKQKLDEHDIESRSAKNFNLLVSLPDRSKLFIKQERFDRAGKTAGEFNREWRIQDFVKQFPEVSKLNSWLPEITDFDVDNSILIVKYLDDHQNLGEFYGQENIFATEIASSIGSIIATIHSQTINNHSYENFFGYSNSSSSPKLTQGMASGLARITPEIFGTVPADGLKFFALYQRYDSLGKAIAQLNESYQPVCLTHNDLKLNNILIAAHWKPAEPSLATNYNQPQVELKLIDWERSGWGDPAFDLGTVIGSYLIIWLQSLIVSRSMAIDESLRLATIPLEVLQPSLVALTKTYATCFPEIVEHDPKFWQKVMQFAGLALIQTIQSTLQYQKAFNNTGICMLQVAKALLCNPESSIASVLGIEINELDHCKS